MAILVFVDGTDESIHDVINMHLAFSTWLCFALCFVHLDDQVIDKAAMASLDSEDTARCELAYRM